LNDAQIGLGSGEEFDRIREFLAGAPALHPGVLLGPGDDAAVLAPDLVISTDLSVEGIHFRLDWLSAREAGARATTAALSDLAAMGAEPIGVLVSVASVGRSPATEAMEGVKAVAGLHGACLLGGDLTRSPGPLLLDVVAVGRTSAPLLRSGARAGDELWVTGVLGGAAAAVALWSGGMEPPGSLRLAFAEPRARMAEARWLLDRFPVRAGLDLSDGLAGDAGHLAAASGVGVVLEQRAIPVHPVLLGEHLPPGRTPLELAIHGGEDYELLLAIEPGGIGPEGVEEFRESFDLRLSRVGRVEGGAGVGMAPADGGPVVRLRRGGYDHFAEGGSP
jgi:thiamine-monophosphate kinase